MCTLPGKLQFLKASVLQREEKWTSLCVLLKGTLSYLAQQCEGDRRWCGAVGRWCGGWGLDELAGWGWSSGDQGRDWPGWLYPLSGDQGGVGL
ncbi:hypothetical protein E2C01_074489 [Portunus trituberculatus]|uniref:Uncharacterized protein n=1 Tax=Portunus trituberculatus TaxID=210409 RepID=A0A5B7I857_PORTR|nr:hypothetical protein [Portunus trituberculatus]